MRPDQLWLTDILSAATSIETFTRGYTKQRFIGDDAIKSAVVFQLVVIGEAANRLDPGLRKRYPNVPWRLAIDQRNVIAHDYFALDWEAIWITAIRDVPTLRIEVEAILEQEFPTSQGLDCIIWGDPLYLQTR